MKKQKVEILLNKQQSKQQNKQQIQQESSKQAPKSVHTEFFMR